MKDVIAEITAENRLVEAGPTEGTQADGAEKVAFAYDYMGRRIRKQVYTWDDPNEVWNVTADRKFVWKWSALLHRSAPGRSVK